MPKRRQSFALSVFQGHSGQNTNCLIIAQGAGLGDAALKTPVAEGDPSAVTTGEPTGLVPGGRGEKGGIPQPRPLVPKRYCIPNYSLSMWRA